MDPVKFRELRDSLNSGQRKAVMIKDSGDWTFKYVDQGEIDVYEGWENNLDGIEYNEVSPDGFKSGNLLGFIYNHHNCPACLGYGKREEDEKNLLKYIWKTMNP